MPTLSGRRNPGTERTPDDGRTIAADPPHYPPREDSFLLLPFTVVPAGTSLLDIGTGSGFLALAAARHGARVVATDLNPHALRRVAEVARREGLNPQLVRTDLARGLGRFDRIVANPPYLPTRPEQRDPERWHNLALDGGPDGCATTARLVATLADHMAPDGRAFILTSSLQSVTRLRAIWDSWRSRGGTVVRVARRDLEGERLEVYRLARPLRRPASSTVRRRRAPRPGTGARRPARRDRRSV
ncbi:MAG: HemK2/MTQ2 family protein methyltransferase [Thermoplasmata archaeon]|jgi:release factor glutamine methyltransferase